MKKVKTTVAFMSGAAFGAGLMYLADPVMGKRRRALARDAAVHTRKVFGRAVDIGARDTAHRLKDMFKEIEGLFKRESIDDQILIDRVRTEVGRVSSHPNVEVIIENGCVTLLGPVVDREEQRVLRAARSVKGVCAVFNRMEPYQPRQNMQIQTSRERQLDILQTHWAPATRILVGAIGVSVAAAGVKGGGVIPRLAGLALVARAATNLEFKRLLRLKAAPASR